MKNSDEKMKKVENEKLERKKWKKTKKEKQG